MCQNVSAYWCNKICKFSPVRSVCRSPSGPDHNNVLRRVFGVDAKVLPTNSEDHGPRIKCC